MAMRNSTLRWMLLDLHEQYRISLEKISARDEDGLFILDADARTYYDGVASGLRLAIEEIETIWRVEED